MEKVHTFALKKLSNVSTRTPNDMAYGEVGRFPLYVHSFFFFSSFFCLFFFGGGGGGGGGGGV